MSQELHRIDDLTLHGIGRGVITRLKGAGFQTIECLLFVPSTQILEVKGISEATANKITAACLKVVPLQFTTAQECLARQSNIFRITTGCEAMDSLLAGGIESGSITEVYGGFRTGKTQLCQTLCVTCQLSRADGGGAGKVIYIDTEGSFRAQRLESIAERFELEFAAVLKNISVVRVQTTDQQETILETATALLVEQRYSLVIVDSLTALFRMDYSGRNLIYARNVHLDRYMRKLQGMAEKFNVAVVVTNEVLCSMNALFRRAGQEPETLRDIFPRLLTTRLRFRKLRDEQRMCQISDSPCLPEAEAVFGIYHDGINDPTDD